MAEGFRGRGGGIAGLLGVVRDHEGAVRHDSLRCGLRLDELGSERFTWADLSALVHHAQPDSAIYKALTGDDWPRSYEVEFLRRIEFLLQVLTWQGADGKGDKPEPVPLPWDEPAEQQPDAMDLDEVFEFMGWERPKELTV